jgi:hypothetical protein
MSDTARLIEHLRHVRRGGVADPVTIDAVIQKLSGNHAPLPPLPLVEPQTTAIEAFDDTQAPLQEMPEAPAIPRKRGRK